MDQETRQLLGFDDAMALVQESTETPGGRRRLAALEPLDDRDRLEKRIELAEEGLRFVAEKGRVRFGHLQDPQDVFKKLRKPGGVLEPDEFLIVLEILKAGRHLLKALSKKEWPLLGETAEGVQASQEAISAIERTFHPDGGIRDSAHPQLSKVRRQAVKQRQSAQKHLEGLFKSKPESVIQDPYVTSRNGRFVIPVRAGRQSSIPGVVHGASSSGATVFLEPMSALELNNQYTVYRQREEEIIQEALTRLSDRLRSREDSLRRLVELIERSDALFAVCEFSRKYRCVMPSFSRDRRLKLDDARHPLLVSSLGDDKVVPISVRLSDQESGLVISGPNTGGKTVALKTVGLLALMAQCGLPVPAGAAVFPMFRAVLADIGDHQSIAARLSTFSAHVLRIRAMMGSLDEGPASEGEPRPTLILLDEIGTGTDPVHGAALAVSVIDFFLERPTLVVATTHHQAVKAFAASREGLVNACVELDPETHRPTYRIRFGLSAGSSGLQVASQLGMPREIIEQARGLMGEADRQAEEYLRHLRRESAELEKARQEAEERLAGLEREKRRLEEERGALIERQKKRFEKSLEEWSKDFKRQGQRYLKRLEDRFEAAQSRKELQRREAALKEAFRRKVRGERGEGEREAPAGGLSSGDWVRHRLFGKRGKVLEVEGEEAQVDFQGKRMACPLDQLEPAEKKEGKSRRLPENVSLDAVEEVSAELNLIGNTVPEAVDKADKYLDRAALSPHRQVRLIHGHGTGRLKGALADFLNNHPHVAGYKGEGGATVVTLRE